MAETNSKPVYRIMDLHESDRPRERLASLGPQALTNAELIAILLRVGAGALARDIARQKKPCAGYRRDLSGVGAPHGGLNDCTESTAG